MSQNPTEETHRGGQPARLSEAEWRVMNVLWSRHPASARELLEELVGETGWAYTTVKTLLARLVEKGLVTAEMRGNTSFYEPVVSRRRARRFAVRSLVDRAFDGTFGNLIHHLVDVERLSAADRRELRRLLSNHDRHER